jgi:hypothetical protein
MRLWSCGVVIAALTATVFLEVGPAFAGAPEVLFDGKTMGSWDVVKCEAVVHDGAILLKSGNGLVQTKRQYTDFVLECEWKALKDKGWDSGIYFRYDRVPDGQPWPNQYQVNLRVGMEGDLVGFQKGRNPIPTKPREWNQFKLTVKGSTAALQVNGKDAWKVDGIEQPTGFVALQAEVPGGGQFLFRKIRVTELSSD